MYILAARRRHYIYNAFFHWMRPCLMMTSSNGNIFRVTGHLCGEFICAGNSPVNGEFPSQRPFTRSFDVFCDLRRNKPLSKQSWVWRFEMPSRLLWRHCNSYDLKQYKENWTLYHHQDGMMPATTDCVDTQGWLMDLRSWNITILYSWFLHMANQLIGSFRVYNYDK